MNPNVVRKLASEFGKERIAEAILEFEKTRVNLLSVEGKDDSEVLSHLLAAEFVRDRMEKGQDLNQSIREYAQRVKSMLAPAGGSKPGK